MLIAMCLSHDGCAHGPLSAGAQESFKQCIQHMQRVALDEDSRRYRLECVPAKRCN
jgi:hypothetical protein